MPTFVWDIDPLLIHYPDWVPLPGGGIRYYSLLYVCVFLGGYKLLDWQLKRAGAPEEDASDFVLYGVIAVLAGARIGHVFFYDIEHFLRDPLWLFMIWTGGLASHGATLGLIIAMWLFTKRRGQSFVEGSDRFAFSAALGSILVRIGNWFNSEIVGRLTDQTWGVRFPRFDGPNAPLRHPSQLYEVALGCFVMLALYLFDRKLGKEKRPRGALISLFFALYFTGRFSVEWFKEHQTADISSMNPVNFWPLTTGQWLSIVPALIGYWGVAYSLKKRVPAEWLAYEEEDDDDANADDTGARDAAKEKPGGRGDADVDAVLAEKGKVSQDAD